eukprot:8842368-Prorocentrum_lima.AAC.1
MVAVSPVRRCTWRGVSSVTRWWSRASVVVVSGGAAVRVRAVPLCPLSPCVRASRRVVWSGRRGGSRWWRVSVCRCWGGTVPPSPVPPLVG